MIRPRYFVPFLGILSLVALFFKLPETPNFFGIFKCKSCTGADPYLPLIGAGYFAMLIALSLLFPAFPGRQTAKGGLTWAVVLAITLTYLNFPAWCMVCLICHTSNILIWTILLVAKPMAREPCTNTNERFCLTLFASISVVALFSCLNLTFMIYGFKIGQNSASIALKPGDIIPNFHTQFNAHTLATNFIVNFISPNCPYCKEQLPILNSVAKETPKDFFHFINISSSLSVDLVQDSPESEWIEDKEGKLRELFKVAGYPTLYVVNRDGTIAMIIPGIPKQLKSDLIALTSPKMDDSCLFVPPSTIR